MFFFVFLNPPPHAVTRWPWVFVLALHSFCDRCQLLWLHRTAFPTLPRPHSLRTRFVPASVHVRWDLGLVLMVEYPVDGEDSWVYFLLAFHCCKQRDLFLFFWPLIISLFSQKKSLLAGCRVVPLWFLNTRIPPTHNPFFSYFGFSDYFYMDTHPSFQFFTDH